jgi:hypothetical protein
MSAKYQRFQANITVVSIAKIASGDELFGVFVMTSSTTYQFPLAPELVGSKLDKKNGRIYSTADGVEKTLVSVGDFVIFNKLGITVIVEGENRDVLEASDIPSLFLGQVAFNKI